VIMRGGFSGGQRRILDFARFSRSAMVHSSGRCAYRTILERERSHHACILVLSPSHGRIKLSCSILVEQTGNHRWRDDTRASIAPFERDESGESLSDVGRSETTFSFLSLSHTHTLSHSLALSLFLTRPPESGVSNASSNTVVMCLSSGGLIMSQTM
jgi:hypothetical protein